MGVSASSEPQDGSARAVYVPLPHPTASSGAPRQIGMEYEFGGMTALQAAETVADVFRGTTTKQNPHAFRVEHPELGAFSIYLDMASTHPEDAESSGVEATIRKTIGDTAQVVVPVEVVCPPMPTESLPELDRMTEALGRAGARGTDHSLFYAFGMHYNVEARDLTVEAILPILRAYVLLEPWLRSELGIDLTRRTFNFVDPFPRPYIDEIAEPGHAPGMAELIATYLRENPTRNRSLDMTPLFAMVDKAAVETALRGAKLKPRPTFHYRLPDCLIGVPGWTSARDWALWVHLEHLAEDRDLIEELAQGWRRHRDRWFTNRTDWVGDIAAILWRRGVADWRTRAGLAENWSMP